MTGMFNEIYGAYYDMMHRILDRAAGAPVTASAIADIVSAYGFAESSLHFTPDALAQDGTGYNLLSQTPDGYASVLKAAPTECLTLNQRRLVKALLRDKRIRLFLDDPEMTALDEALKEVAPLYGMDDIVMTETAADSDDYADAAYRERFRVVLNAIRQQQALIVVYNSSRGERKTVRIAPYKLEYAVRDDKFRLCGVSLYKDRPSKYIKLNVMRMLHVKPVGPTPRIDSEAFIERKMLKEPITVEVSDFRNGFERIFIGLSNYRRTSSLDEETGKCTMQIYCTDDDVQELLIVMLSYGPAIRVIGPPEFREKYVERVRRQMELLKVEDERLSDDI